ncbi:MULTISPECIES: N-acetyl-gamma-glutamyl-phosphate reductase [unclassified Sphingopyxis]|uniref:N-acetyl-gamma-glutamyl-phosphate reductase n=1 Tax=unclassified Sphingopyxis TaxID=2614943 RepID=UPI0007370874|nr:MULTISPECIES: N-acetyl-gamma-glutamyl-phosphate reductase [unclassified Sphingopyxis]KTE40703.1 N-acetyl-gamma-glutamyl-phosphate reductase [Sphingopyxis sp. HIX]KTE83967.1 N-acetyl-gamma-glutamyl-phosphate reductase [Sphingopyxis sp. HXXIV]
MTYTVFIDGAAGTTGLEIAERLAGRAEFSLLTLDEARRKDADARRAALNDADFVILCLPDAAAIEAVAMIANDRTKVIDASTAHRVAPGWAYGFPELSAGQREAIAAATRVSNPGCYPTGFLALVAPLVAAGIVDRQARLSVNAVSGYSGGGKELIARFEAEPDIGFRGYGLSLAHKHVPEMQHGAGLTHSPLFAPAVVPVYRGMLVEVPLAFDAPTADAAYDALAAHYAGSPLVSVRRAGDESELLLRKDDAATDAMELMLYAGADGTQLRLVARLDNLGKGASGACVQNLNIMAGLPETAGLRI